MPRHGCTNDSQLGPPQGAPPEESGPGRGGCGSSPDQDRSQAELGSAQSERDPARREAAVMAITKRAYLPFVPLATRSTRGKRQIRPPGLLHAARAFRITNFPYSSAPGGGFSAWGGPQSGTNPIVAPSTGAASRWDRKPPRNAILRGAPHQTAITALGFSQNRKTGPRADHSAYKSVTPPLPEPLPLPAGDVAALHRTPNPPANDRTPFSLT